MTSVPRDSRGKAPDAPGALVAVENGYRVRQVFVLDQVGYQETYPTLHAALASAAARAPAAESRDG